MAAGGGCGESVDQYRAEVERLTQELAEANREKIRAAEYGLVVLEENQALKQKYADLETEQETLRKELEQLQEVGGRGAVACWHLWRGRRSLPLSGVWDHFHQLRGCSAFRSDVLLVVVIMRPAQPVDVCATQSRVTVGSRNQQGSLCDLQGPQTNKQ